MFSLQRFGSHCFRATLLLSLLLLAAPGYTETWGRSVGAGLDYVHERSDGTVLVAARGWIACINRGGNTLWQKYYPGFYYGSSYVSTQDGGLLVAGYDTVYKLDSLGKMQWAKQVKSYVELNGAAQLMDQSFVVVGRSPNDTLLVVKLSASGTIAWQFQFNTAEGAHVSATADGGFIVATTKASLLKFNADGSVAWQKKYSIQIDDFRRLRVIPVAGGYVFGGTTYLPGTTSLNSNFFLIGTDRAGRILWQHIVGTKKADYLADLVPDGSGFVTIGVNILQPNGPIQAGAILLKFDASGSLLWRRSFHEYKSYYSGRSLSLTGDGGYIVAASIRNDGSNEGSWLLRTDSNGQFAAACGPLSFEPNVVIYPSNAKASSHFPVPGASTLTLENLPLPAPQKSSILNFPICRPVLTQLSDNYLTGHNRVTVFGRQLGDADSSHRLYIGAVEVPPAEIVTWTPSSVDFSIPLNAPSGRVSVSVDGQRSNGLFLLIFPRPPQVMLPDAGPTGGGNTVTIIRPVSAYIYADQVYFGAARATESRAWNDYVICKAPPGNGTVDVTLRWYSGQTLIGKYTYR